jgi:hypothetical protein
VPVDSDAPGDQPLEVGLQGPPVERVDDDVVTAVHGAVPLSLPVQPSGGADRELEGLLARFPGRPGQHLDEERESVGVVRDVGVGIDVGCEQVADLGVPSFLRWTRCRAL